MQHLDIAQHIVAMHQADLRLRAQLVGSVAFREGYHPELEALHQHHADQLANIIRTIGFPTITKVGHAAHEAAWLILQHAISRPALMRQAAQALRAAVNDKDGSPELLAHLEDRIAVLSGQKQRYGTQFDWDAAGQLSPYPVDNWEAVNERRAALGMVSLEAQTQRIRARAAQEGQQPPQDHEAKQAQYQLWRKKVGWDLT